MSSSEDAVAVQYLYADLKKIMSVIFLSQVHALDADVKPKLSAMKGYLSSSAIITLDWSSHSFTQPVTVLNCIYSINWSVEPARPSRSNCITVYNKSQITSLILWRYLSMRILTFYRSTTPIVEEVLGFSKSPP